jgi:uncharacterized protein
MPSAPIFLLVIFYASMATAALAVELAFGALHLIPEQRKAQIVEESIHWNYATILNMLSLLLASALIIRFLRTGGPAMLRIMSASSHQANEHPIAAHSEHHHHG